LTGVSSLIATLISVLYVLVLMSRSRVHG
jgi:hypothetical protein